MMNNSGIYIVQLLNETPMPVTRDPRYVDICAKVDRSNIKVGKANNFAGRRSDYWKDFDAENIVFEPLAWLVNTKAAEKAVLKALNEYRKLSPKGGRLEWLEGISYEEAKQIAFAALDKEGIEYALQTKEADRHRDHSELGK